METAVHWILIGIGIMFLISLAIIIVMTAWICYLTQQLHQLRRPPEVQRDGAGRKLKERLY